MADEKKLEVKPTPTISQRTGGLRTRGGRLPPIRSRDVAPTVSAAPRRTFAPNIPQRRAKKEEKSPLTALQSSSAANSKNAKDTSQRGRGRGRREYVQIEGSLFGEGITMDPALKKEARSHSDIPSDYIIKPTYKPKKTKTKEEIAEEERRCIEEDDDFSGSDGEDNELPIILSKKAPVKKEIKENIKQETKKETCVIKGEDGTEKNVKIKKETDADIKEERKPVIEEHDLKNILLNSKESNAEKLFLVQFPDNLFYENETLDDAPSSSKSTNQSSQIEEKTSGATGNLIEGLVGKLQVLKSGKIRLLCGDMIMDIQDSDLSNFYEDLVVIKGNEEPNAEVKHLGLISKHLMILPAIESLKV